MATTNFVDGQTVIEASWLNDVDDAVYNPPSVILPATSVTTTAISGITATDVQGVLAEIVAEKAALVHVHAGTDITSGAVAIANGGTGQTTAALAFTALKQVATEIETGVVEIATQGEAEAGTDDTVVMTPLKTAQAIAANSPPIAKFAAVSSNDTTPGYLNGKLVAGAKITLTEGSDGADETLTISSTTVPLDAGSLGVGLVLPAYRTTTPDTDPNGTSAGGALMAKDPEGGGTLLSVGTWRNISNWTATGTRSAYFQRIA